MSQSIFCYNCGKQILQTEATCPICGAPQKAMGSSPPSAAANSDAVIAPPVTADTPTQNGLTTRQILITGYLVIAMGFTVYESLFGAENYRGFFYNFGKSLVWPFLVFPILGKIVGSILLLVIIGAVIVSPYLSDERDK